MITYGVDLKPFCAIGFLERRLCLCKFVEDLETKNLEAKG